MYAVIRTGGKQYRVNANDLIRVEKLTAKAGEVVDLTEVLAVGDDKAATMGKPLVSGAAVKAEVVDQVKSDKVLIFKRRRRKHHRRTRGHRQNLTVLRITEISAPDGRKMTAAEAKAAKPKAAKPKKKKAAKSEDAAESKE